jgi:hypothetical protein
MDEQIAAPAPQPQIQPQPEIKPKIKHRIPLKVKILVVLLGAVTLFFATVNVKELISKRKDAQINYKKQEDIQKPAAEEWKNFEGTDYKFTLKYPSTATVETSKENDQDVITISYNGSRQTSPTKEPLNLVDGYIFKVIIHPNVINTDTGNTADRKKDSLMQICLQNDSGSNVTSGYVDTIPSSSFSLINCPYDIREVFVVIHSSLYEFVQTYRGDLGYKEKYKQLTDQIMNSVVFLDKPQDEEAPKYIPYTSKPYNFSFMHPRMDSTCCDINGPVYGNPVKVVVLADAATFEASGGKSFDGFGIFVDENKENISFESYMDIQKTSLIEDYKVITGQNPQTSEEETTVGEEKAVLLKGYTWWGGNLIFLKIPSSDNFMSISLTSESSDNFTEEIKSILKSFQFNLKK